MKILWLKTELLHPVDKGGKIRTYQMLRQLRREHEITYLTLTDPADAPETFDLADEYCHHLVSVPHGATPKFSVGFYCELGFNLGSSLPYAIQRYRSAAMQRAIEQQVQRHDYDVVVCDFLTPSVNLPQGVNLPTVLFQHNVEAVIWERHYQNEMNRLKRAYFFNQWRKMLAYERKACRQFDAVVAVSDVDRDLMRRDFGIERVYAIPTGVDTEYFAPRASFAPDFAPSLSASLSASLSQSLLPSPELVFTGSMDWMPNEDAMLYFASEILPRIAARLPDVRVTIVGRNPTPRLAALAAGNPQITVTGRVDDVRPYIERAAAYVVPIRVGGGTRLKIYEAMAMAKPVISTTIGAEGLAVRDGEELLLADDPQTFAQAVITALQEREWSARLGQRARAVVCQRFGWQQVAAAFARVCEGVGRRRVAARAA